MKPDPPIFDEALIAQRISRFRTDDTQQFSTAMGYHPVKFYVASIERSRRNNAGWIFTVYYPPSEQLELM